MITNQNNQRQLVSLFIFSFIRGTGALFEMNLKRVGHTDWPSGGAIPMK